MEDDILSNISYDEICERDTLFACDLKKKIKFSASNKNVVHVGFKCNKCNQQPIVGVRWFCFQCRRAEKEFNLCNICKYKICDIYDIHEHTLACIKHNTTKTSIESSPVMPDKDPREPIGYQFSSFKKD